MDIGHEETELILKETERDVKRLYLQAQAEAQAKLEDYLRRYATKDAIKREQLARHEIKMKDYAQWRKGQICIGQRWQELVNTLAQDYTNADRIAMSIVNGHMPDAYALNHNYATFQVEKGAMIDTSYTLYDRATVERLIRDNPDLLPEPKVDIPKDTRWNRTHLKDAITQGILQGEDLRKVAKRLQHVTDMDYGAAMRNARTMMTAAQNAGRVNGYRRAEGMGIKLEQEWLATLDGRTRHSHRQMDGQHVKVGEKFSNGCEYPGDPSGPAAEVYNCRCTLVPRVQGVDQSNAPRNSKLGSMSYQEWKDEHKERYEKRNKTFQADIPDLQTAIGRATTIQQINDIMNGQGWFKSYTKKVPTGEASYYDRDHFKWVTPTRDEIVPTLVDLTGCDLESAKSIAASYQQVFERYPKLKGKLDAPNAQPIGMSKDTYAWCYTRSNGMVQVNPRHFGSWESLVRSYEKDVISGWHPYGTTAESIVTHEIGHAVDGYLAHSGVLGGRTASGEYRLASSSLKTTIMKRASKIDPDLADLMMMDRNWGGSEAVGQYVSRYATKNAQEWFAECFAEYITSAEPRLVASEFGKELEKLMEKLP